MTAPASSTPRPHAERQLKHESCSNKPAKQTGDPCLRTQALPLRLRGHCHRLPRTGIFAILDIPASEASSCYAFSDETQLRLLTGQGLTTLTHAFAAYVFLRQVIFARAGQVE